VQTRNRHHSYFEFLVICLLAGLACWRAWSFSFAGFLTLFHACFLVTGYLTLRLLVARANKWVGRLVFAGFFLLLAGDFLVSFYTDLHINVYILSLTVQPGFAASIGASPWLLFGGVFAAILACLLAATRLEQPSFRLQARVLAALTFSALLLSQASFGWHYFHGNSEIEEIRRELPFFNPVHPYRINTLFGLKEHNPDAPPAFALRSSEPASPAANAPLETPKHSKNILLIVADSLRAQDLINTPALMPTLQAIGAEGSLSLSHTAASNCTHFSLYSLFTGQLPTRFGEDRRRGTATGLLASLKAAGYQLSTAEAATLDWYETSRIIFPQGTERIEIKGETQTEKDASVTDATIVQLEEYSTSTSPFFHLAYYYGTHYPYDPEVNDTADSTLDRYYLTMGTLDKELSKLHLYLQETGLLKHTIVVVTSDHGEEFTTENGRAGHGSVLSDEQILVPFAAINQTGAALGPIPGNQQAVGTWLMGTTPPATNPTIVSQCGYDYPRGFLVKYEEGAVGFDISGGYLSPVDGDLSAEIKGKAAFDLIRAIQKN